MTIEEELVDKRMYHYFEAWRGAEKRCGELQQQLKDCGAGRRTEKSCNIGEQAPQR